MRTLRKVGSEKAITLIALVVTIVILLILAGVTITMTLGENGLFTKAREGKEVYDEASVKEDLSMLITQYTWDKVAGNTDKSLGDYLKDNGATSVKEKTDGKTIEVEYKSYVFTVNKNSGDITEASKKDDGTPIIKPKVGDIVNYKPDTPSTGYDLNIDESGYDTDQIIDSSYDPTIWKIMEINENGRITKLFGVPSSGQKEVYFKGARGYNNGVYLLNDICKSRYGNASLGAISRSITIEDIESRMNATGIAARNANKGYNNQSIQYGTTKTYSGDNAKYPAIYTQEKYSGVDVSDITEGTQIITGDVDTIAKSKMNPNGKIGSDNIYTTLPEISETTGPLKTNLTCTQTYYRFDSTPSLYFNDTNFYNMIFGTGTEFWIASRYVHCASNSLYARFGLRFVSNSNLGGYGLFHSIDKSYSDDYCLAPVVAFDSGIQVKSGSGTEGDPYEIGKYGCF